MARIAGVDLPNKAVKIALTYIYGIGRTSAADICKKTNIDPDVRINTLSSDELALLRKVIEEDYKIEGHLRTEVALNIKRLMDIGCYREKGPQEDCCEQEEVRAGEKWLT